MTDTFTVYVIVVNDRIVGARTDYGMSTEIKDDQLILRLPGALSNLGKMPVKPQ